MVKGPDFSSKIKQILAQRAGQTCSNPDCRKTTSGPHSKENKAVNNVRKDSLGGARTIKTDQNFL